MVDGTGLEQHGHAAGGATNTPVGCLLVRGSQRVGMSTKKDAARPLVWGLFSWWRYRTRTARAERSEGNQSPSGALISARFPTPRNVYRDDCRFVSDGTGLEPGQTKAGYHHGGGILPFALKSSSHCVNLISLMEKIILLVCAFVHLVRGANLLGAGVSVNGHISGAAFNDAALGAACNGTGCNGTVNAALY